MFIKNRTKTNNIIVLTTKTEAKEDIGVRELDRLHRDKGCVMVGFHYIIKRDGMVETGRELDKLGHHRRKYNRDSVYVALVGKDDNLTDEQAVSLDEILEELKDLYPEAEVLELI